VRWDPVTDDSGIDHYRVAVDGTRRVETGATSAVVDGLNPGTEYDVSVTAVDVVGNEATTTRTVGTSPDGSVSAPSNLAATPGETTVSLSWDAVPDASGIAGYVVRTRQNGTEIASQPVSGTNVTVAALSPGTAYTFAVTVEDGAGNTATSSATATTTGESSAAPDAPSALSIDGKTISSITVSWTAPDATVDHYAVSLDGTNVLSTRGTTAEITGLDHGTEYDLAVVTVTPDGVASEPTPTQRVTTASVTRDRTTDALAAWRRSEPPTDATVPRTDDRVDYGTVRAMVAEMEADDE
jgi:chitodextrinase